MEEPIWENIHESEACTKPNNLFREVSNNHVQGIAYIDNFVREFFIILIDFSKAVEFRLCFLLPDLTKL